MAPIVDGLVWEYRDWVYFRALDAASGVGLRAFRDFQMPGHPGYIILSPEGEVLWLAFGPQERTTLKDAIEDALAAGLR